MPVLRDWDLIVDADRVLRGQGADPAVIRARHPGLVEVAAWAIAEGQPLLEPAVLYERLPVRELRHERLVLAAGEPAGAASGSSTSIRSAALRGSLVAQHLAGAQEVLAAVCTLGQPLVDLISDVFREEPVRGLALDGYASAAIEALGEALCQRFDALAAAQGWQASIPLSPGMVGWPLIEGQEQIFGLVDTAQIGVRLTSSGLMVPLKSISMVVGIGPALERAGRTCDFCAMRETCRYQDHYH